MGVSEYQVRRDGKFLTDARMSKRPWHIAGNAGTGLRGRSTKLRCARLIGLTDFPPPKMHPCGVFSRGCRLPPAGLHIRQGLSTHFDMEQVEAIGLSRRFCPSRLAVMRDTKELPQRGVIVDLKALEPGDGGGVEDDPQAMLVASH
jgi:hypothetical protein